MRGLQTNLMTCLWRTCLWRLSSSGTRMTLWLRLLHDTSCGLGRGVDPVGFASGVGERPVSFDRIVFNRMGSDQPTGL